MYDQMRNTKFRNILIILSLFIGLLFLGYFIVTFHERTIIWSHYPSAVYDKRIKNL